MELTVSFNTRKDGSGRRMRAIAGPDVKAVFLSRAAADEFQSRLAQRLPQRPARTPPGVTIMEVRKAASGSDTLRPSQLVAGDDGPGDICYWIGGELICWEEEL